MIRRLPRAALLPFATLCPADRRPGAGSALAAVAGRAGEAIVTAGSVGLGRVRAQAGARVTGAGSVALIGGGTDHGIGPGAGSALAGIGLGAAVAVVTGCPVGCVG